MIQNVIYSEDEKIVREYNVFKGKRNASSKKGVDLILTDKRVVVKTYNNDIFNKQIITRETLISNLSGDINVSTNRKINLFLIIMCIISSLSCIITGVEMREGFLTVLLIIFGLLFVGLVVLLCLFPKTEGRIVLYNTNALKDGIFVSGGNIIKTKGDVVSVVDIEKGKDFDMFQEEIGYLLISLKSGKDVDELIEKLNSNKKTHKQRNSNRMNSQKVKQNYYDDDDDEIPSI